MTPLHINTTSNIIRSAEIMTGALLLVVVVLAVVCLILTWLDR